MQVPVPMPKLSDTGELIPSSIRSHRTTNLPQISDTGEVIGQEQKKKKNYALGRTVGKSVGGFIGGIAGGSVGTAVAPGLGTAAGKLVGNRVGSNIGEKVGVFAQKDAENGGQGMKRVALKSFLGPGMAMRALAEEVQQSEVEEDISMDM